MKNRKIFKLIPILLLLAFNCNGQGQEEKLHKEDVKELLIQFLISIKEASKYEEKSILFLTDLRFDDGRNLFKEGTEPLYVKSGVYSFGLLGPHFNNYLMIVSTDITLIKNYRTEVVLLKLSDFYRHNSNKFSEDEKIQITKNALKILSIRELNQELDKDIIDIDLNEY
jgi:hypothetical protein